MHAESESKQHRQELMENLWASFTLASGTGQPWAIPRETQKFLWHIRECNAEVQPFGAIQHQKEKEIWRNFSSRSCSSCLYGAGHKRGWQIKDAWEQRVGGMEVLVLELGVSLAEGEYWCEAHTQVRLAGRSWRLNFKFKLTGIRIADIDTLFWELKQLVSNFIWLL